VHYPISDPSSAPQVCTSELNLGNEGLADPTMKARIASLGAAVFASSPAEFGKGIAVDTEKWAKVAKFAGLMPV
jgi:hypothetical protein